VWLLPPPVPWTALIPTGLTLFAGQFLFQFFGIAHGMPPGLASVIVQSQALFTIVFAALALGERPTRRQWLGIVVALTGLAAIATTVGANLTLAGLLLTLVSPISFGIGNVLLKRLAPVDMLRLTVWLSLVPPLPALTLSIALDGPIGFITALTHGSWIALLSAIYLGVVATTTRSGVGCCVATPRRWSPRSRCSCRSSPRGRRRWPSASASGRCGSRAWRWCCSASP